jgi:hypothetical protein
MMSTNPLPQPHFVVPQTHIMLDHVKAQKMPEREAAEAMIRRRQPSIDYMRPAITGRTCGCWLTRLRRSVDWQSNQQN